MRILAFDFETANANRSSPCSIGFYMEDIDTGQTILEEEILINPEQEFDSFNIMIHGITPDKVADQPNFIAAYNRLMDLIADDVILLAHNAPFDISVLRSSCDRYSLPYPSVMFLDTLILSKVCFADFPTHRLDYLADRLNIPLQSHHNAAEDAKACYLIYDHMRCLCECRTPHQVIAALGIEFGYLRHNSYSTCGKSSRCSVPKIQNRLDQYSRFLDEIQPDIDESHPFFGKVIVFTGTLHSMSRITAAEKVERVGGIFADSLTKRTNILVTGIREGYYHEMSDKSLKLMKAEKLIQQGAGLEIICEKDFLEML